ncbi:ParA family protein [Sphingomonas sp. CARO-RG-8B-R24-01]|uniref:ParA family protein n=1 Tax=Sphingomonas sp. CARO-RG-8B-R24-01 TaxID=2914831 RepID=UPI001F5966E3
MKSYIFFVSKGGAAKTTLAVHFAWFLRKLERRVLFVDLDPQANAANILTRYAGKEAAYKPNTLGDMADIIDPDSPWTKGKRPVPSTGFDIVRVSTAAVLEDSDVDDAIAALDHISGISEPEPLYDNVVFDLAPTFSAHHAIALVWADNLVMPLDMSSSGIDGVDITDATVESFNKFRTTPLVDCGIVAARYDGNTTHKAVLEEAKMRHRDRMLSMPFHDREAFQRGIAQCIPPWQIPEQRDKRARTAELQTLFGDILERGGDGYEA